MTTAIKTRAGWCDACADDNCQACTNVYPCRVVDDYCQMVKQEQWDRAIEIVRNGGGLKELQAERGRY